MNLKTPSIISRQQDAALCPCPCLQRQDTLTGQSDGLTIVFWKHETIVIQEKSVGGGEIPELLELYHKIH